MRHRTHRAMLLLAALLFARPAHAAPTSNSALGILPLGDSITYGYDASGSSKGGYRTPLYNDLTTTGRLYTFVGSSSENPATPTLPFNQSAHEGHPGYRIDQIANNLNGSDGTGGNNGGNWFNQDGEPNLILLHIGTNDIAQNYQVATAPNRLDALIGQLVADWPKAHILVASIIPINIGSLNAEVQTYNAQIPGIVSRYAAKHKRVYFVDQYHNFINSDGSINGSLLPDGVHPNGVGYALMAHTWFQGITGIYPTPVSQAQSAFSFAANNAADFNSGHFCLGYSITPNVDVTVTALGFYDSGQDGLTQSHAVGIFDSKQTLLVSVLVTPSAPLDHLFRYVSSPATPLKAGQTYYVVATTGDEKYAYNAYGFASNPLVTYGTDYYIVSDTLAFPTMNSPPVDPAWFGPNFKLIPAP